MNRTSAPTRLASVVLCALIAVSPAAAQQQPQARQPAPAAKGALPAVKDAGPAADSGLRQRVEQLEAQLADMHVLVGTMESLARGAPASGSPGMRTSPGASAALDASEAGRLDGLEMQLRALAAQLEQLQEQVRMMGTGRSGALAPATSVAGGDLPPQPQVKGPRVSGAMAQQEGPGGFGSLTVSQGGDKDDINRILTQPGGGPGVDQTASLGTQLPAVEVDPRQQYSTAYGYLAQRDYASAEAAFEEFLRQHPKHPLAGNALYWMGESLYVRGQYRAAASAFLKGYQNHVRSEKAPESLLKLAMSLQRLGQKDAACSSFDELTSKFPNAPAPVKSTAQSERQRVGC